MPGGKNGKPFIFGLQVNNQRHIFDVVHDIGMGKLYPFRHAGGSGSIDNGKQVIFTQFISALDEALHISVTIGPVLE